MGLIEKAAALTMASSMLASPAAAESPSPQELENTRLDYPLQILEKLTDVSSPQISDIYNEISQDPGDHIEIFGPSGYHEFSPPGFYSYYIFADEDYQKDSQVPWSIGIMVGDPERGLDTVSVALFMNQELNVFQGEDDNYFSFRPIPEEYLQNASENLFNVPEEMIDLPWTTDEAENIEIFNREYTDESGKHFMQTVTAQNIIIFESPSSYLNISDL